MFRQQIAILACACLANVFAAPAEKTATLDWAHGAASWQQATEAEAEGNSQLWSKPNYCDSRVLHGSAPLTVLFGISSFWDEIKQRRLSLAQAGAAAPENKPLEIHVLGAAYPFEGRSDWSLLASRRPADVPGVRVVLVLGTPWHQDNVPIMKAEEFDDQRSFLMQIGAKTRTQTPETGKIRGGAIECAKDGSLAGNDDSFRVADLCKDHGNGLEVVCVEKYYQEVSDQLPKPDLVAMFSPGFPQIARRSWDTVLRSLLASEVPIMVGDLLYSRSVESVFKHGKQQTVAAPGAKWSVRRSSFEDGMTLRAMRAYGARRLGAFRNPFPILITKGPVDVTAKNAVLQVFRGRLSHAKPLKMPSEKAVAKRKKTIEAMNLKHFMDDKDSAEEIQTSMLLATSKAYDKAMWQNYRREIRSYVEEQIAQKKKKGKTIDPKWLSMVEKMGLTEKSRKSRRKPWTLKEWIFVLEKIPEVDDEVF